MLTVGLKIKKRPTFFRAPMDATVIYIHPAGRFAVLEFDLSTTGVMGERLERKMCIHWDDVRCLKGCDNCDECSQFQRITPQYCARCGATFYERREQRFCQACRTARKKQAQRRWARQKAGG